MSVKKKTEEEFNEYLKDETVSPYLRAIAYLSREFTKEVKRKSKQKKK